MGILSLLMSTIVPHPSLPVGLSYSEFLQWLDEDVRAEWVDGEIFIISPASRRRQRLSDFLTAILKLYVEPNRLGEVTSAPFQMKPSEELPGREPDILFVAGERLHIIQDTFVAGPADLVVEILSPESRKRDTVDKFSEYERAGVCEYWMIDPENRDAKFFELTSGQYSLIPTEQRIFRSQRIEGFWLDLDWLWAEPTPSIPEIQEWWRSKDLGDGNQK